MRLSLLYFLFCLSVTHNVNGSGENTLIKEKDLKGEWKFFDGKKYSIVAIEDQHNTIYLQIDPIATPKHYLIIQSEQFLDIFIEGQLIASQVVQQIISLDSLSKQFSGKPFQVAIHARELINLQKLETNLSVKGAQQNSNRSPDTSIELREPGSFRDFVVLVLVILFVYWVISIRVSPRLFADYFSVTKLFFGRETEDYQYFRITSATILFYGFSCLTLSLFFFITDHFYDIPVIPGMNSANSFIYFIGQWLLLSLILFSALLVKIILLFMLANIFDIKEIAGFQFFNFMRLLLIILVLLTLSISSYYLLHGLEPTVYQVFYKILGWVMLFWIVMIFFKLVSRVPFSLIHLFLYICATEIIPFLVTVKILYK
jgi:hypothetical protein